MIESTKDLNTNRYIVYELCDLPKETKEYKYVLIEDRDQGKLIFNILVDLRNCTPEYIAAVRNSDGRGEPISLGFGSMDRVPPEIFRNGKFPARILVGHTFPLRYLYYKGFDKPYAGRIYDLENRDWRAC